MNEHPFSLDDIAAFALGASPHTPMENCVSEHLKTCPSCRAEYDALHPAVTALAESARAPYADPSLKARVMSEVRGERRAPNWPPYLVAAACLIIALISTVQSISLDGEVRALQTQLTAVDASAKQSSREDASDKTMLADLMSSDATRYALADGSVVVRDAHLYLTLHDLPALKRNRVYQAWTRRAGSDRLNPSSTFSPDSRGVAIVALPDDARSVRFVAISVEPEGGSKAPTTRPIASASLGAG